MALNDLDCFSEMPVKRLLGLLWCCIAVGSTNPCSTHAEALRVGVSGLSAEFTPVWAANERGIFKKYGFESEIIAMQGGTQLAQATHLDVNEVAALAAKEMSH